MIFQVIILIDYYQLCKSKHEKWQRCIINLFGAYSSVRKKQTARNLFRYILHLSHQWSSKKSHPSPAWSHHKNEIFGGFYRVFRDTFRGRANSKSALPLKIDRKTEHIWLGCGGKEEESRPRVLSICHRSITLPHVWTSLLTNSPLRFVRVDF